MAAHGKKRKTKEEKKNQRGKIALNTKQPLHTARKKKETRGRKGKASLINHKCMPRIMHKWTHPRVCSLKSGTYKANQIITVNILIHT